MMYSMIEWKTLATEIRRRSLDQSLGTMAAKEKEGITRTIIHEMRDVYVELFHLIVRKPHSFAFITFTSVNIKLR